MFKKIIEWIAKKLLWPLLEALLKIIVEELLNRIIEIIKEWLKERKERDVNNARTPDERSDIENKYDNLINEMDNIKQNISVEIPSIIHDGFLKGESDRDQLLKKLGSSDKKQLKS